MEDRQLLDLWIRKTPLVDPEPVDVDFCWGWPTDDPSRWEKFSIPVEDYLVLNSFLNMRQCSSSLGLRILLKAQHEKSFTEGFADDAMPPGGMITF
jgi:hypothetical protein